jgi:hypothetical protein
VYKDSIKKIIIDEKSCYFLDRFNNRAEVNGKKAYGMPHIALSPTVAHALALYLREEVFPMKPEELTVEIVETKITLTFQKDRDRPAPYPRPFRVTCEEIKRQADALKMEMESITPIELLNQPTRHMLTWLLETLLGSKVEMRVNPNEISWHPPEQVIAPPGTHSPVRR